MLGPGTGTVGGIATLAQTLVQSLEQQVDLMYLPTVERRARSESGKLSWKNIRTAISLYGRFVLAILRFRPQIIHIHTADGIAWLKDSLLILFGKVFHCRIVLHVHGGAFDQRYHEGIRLVRTYTRYVMGLADVILAISGEWQKRLASIAPADRIFTFSNCIAVDEIPFSLSQPSGSGTDLLFLGKVGAGKGIFDLLDAMKRLKSANLSLTLWIAGDEESTGDIARVNAQIKEYELEEICETVGVVYGKSKLDLLAKTDIFVLPSYSEGLPIAVLEALASGLAVITTPVGGIPEVVKDGYNGFLIAPGNVDALTEKILLLATDERICNTMGQRSRKFAEQELDVKPYVERLRRLYESLLPEVPNELATSLQMDND